MERVKQIDGLHGQSHTRNWFDQFLSGFSFRRKLILGVVLLMGAILMATFLLAIANEYHLLRKSLQHNIDAESQVIALNSVDLVTGDDHSKTEEVLNAIASIDRFMYAVIYLPNGEVFSSYTNLLGTISLSDRLDLSLISSNDDLLTSEAEIRKKGNVLGKLVIAVKPYTLSELFMSEFSFFMGIFFLLSGIIVLYITILLRYISSPLTQLTGVMSRVTQKADYSLRSGFKSNDEIGALSRGFDRMLDMIEERENELALHRGQLEKMVEERTEALNKEVAGHKQTVEKLEEAKISAETANKTKSEFLANMSHEIRTPLTAIIGFAESTMEKDQTIEERINAVDIIIRNGKHLLTIINEILDLAKIESGKIDIEHLQVSLHTLVEDVRSLLAIQAQDNSLAIDVDYRFPLPKNIITDPTRLKQILLNLGSNAIKFTNEGRVAIVVSCDQGRNKLIFKVIDTGIGMSHKQLENLFTPFVQGDQSTTRRFGGTGLGLFISQQLANMLGGDISVRSEVGKGSEFDISIDAGDLTSLTFCSSMADFQDKKESTGAKGIPKLNGSILLAEDNPDNQALISLYVRKTGAKIDMVENGQVAFEKAMNGDYQLILMDMQMPVMDGIESTLKLREAGCRTPIVSLTANASGQDIDNCFGAGATGFLSKPIEWDKFFSTLSVYLPAADVAISQEPIAAEIKKSDKALETACANFIKALPGKLTNICQKLNEQAWAELENEFIEIKLSGGAFGYPMLSDKAGKLAFVIKKRSYEELYEGVQELSNIIDRIECAVDKE